MTRELIIEKTMQALQKLPHEKAEEIADFAEYNFKKVRGSNNSIRHRKINKRQQSIPIFK